jgi:hypothetical protein
LLKDGRTGLRGREIDRVPRKRRKRVPMANKRMSKRIKMVLPVKILIDNVTHLAHTLDITSIGGRLGALRTQLKPGAIISLQRGQQKPIFAFDGVASLAQMNYRLASNPCSRIRTFGASACRTTLRLRRTNKSSWTSDLITQSL